MIRPWILRSLILAIFGIAAKLERYRIIDRTARGRADAKAKGVKFGRKPKLTPHQKAEAIKRRDKDGETLRSIARSYNVSVQTIGALPVTDPDIVPPDKPPEVKFRYEATSQLRKKLSVSGGASSPPPKDTGRGAEGFEATSQPGSFPSLYRPP